jgi:nitrate/nitrite transport system ATP-binding protein
VVLITNDVDEGILLADRIIPLSAGPAATLGPAIRVDLARPRDRKAVNHDPRFQEIRNEVIHYLLGAGRKTGVPSSAGKGEQKVPQLQPTDLSVVPRRGFFRARNSEALA